MVEAESQASEGVREAVDSDPKQLARQLLSEGLDVDSVVAQSGLTRPVVLGISGALKKAQKKLAATEDKAAKDSPSENLGEEEITLDMKKEAQITNSAVALARSQQRLKSLDPALYQALHGPGQAESSSSKTLIDIETAKLIRSWREEEPPHRNNGDGAEASETALLRKELETAKEEMRRRDVEDLKGQIAELRQDLRHSANSASDLAVVVRETSNLIGKALESPGVLRNYLLPADAYIKDKAEAPLLHQQTGLGTRSVVSALHGHGLVTKIIERKGD